MKAENRTSESNLGKPRKTMSAKRRRMDSDRRGESAEDVERRRQHAQEQEHRKERNLDIFLYLFNTNIIFYFE